MITPNRALVSSSCASEHEMIVINRAKCSKIARNLAETHLVQGVVSMSRQRWVRQLVRLSIYLGAGVLPALSLALPSLLLITGDAWWLSIFAWAGTLGLILAALNRPSGSELRTKLVIATMLALGLIAISFLAPLDFSVVTGAGWFFVAAVGAPPVLAAHYIWQALRFSSVSERRVLAGVLSGVVATALITWLVHPAPQTQEVYETAQVEEVTLLVVNEAGQNGASMGLSYLSKAPYTKINYDGRTYTPLASGAMVSVPWNGVSSRYVVTEHVQSNSESDSWPTKVTWVVRDEQEGVVMATRELWRKGMEELSTDTPKGWQGDHAVKFIQGVLQPTQSGNGRGAGYRTTETRFEQADMLEPLANSELRNGVSGCADRIEINRKKRAIYVQSRLPDWRFEPRNPAEQVFCIGSEIYVLSTLMSDGIYVDRLSANGQLIEQYYLSLRQSPPLKGNYLMHVSSLSVDQSGLSMLVSFSNLAQRSALTLRVISK